MTKMYRSSNFFISAYYAYSNNFQEADKSSLPTRKAEFNVGAVFRNFVVLSKTNAALIDYSKILELIFFCYYKHFIFFRVWCIYVGLM